MKCLWEGPVKRIKLRHGVVANVYGYDMHDKQHDSLGCGSEESNHTQGPRKCKVKLTSSQQAEIKLVTSEECNYQIKNHRVREKPGSRVIFHRAEQYGFKSWNQVVWCSFPSSTNLETLGGSSPQKYSVFLLCGNMSMG